MDFVEDDKQDLGGLKAMAYQITLGLTIDCLHYPTPNPMTNLEIKYKLTTRQFVLQVCHEKKWDESIRFVDNVYSLL